jgi:radical SAM protein with 4Fe4S-binding SPASM domain
MIIIQNEINVKNILGFQDRKSEIKYRMLNYVVKYPISGGELILNTLTRGFVFIPTAELYSDSTIQYLINHWYMVEQDFNDDKLFKQYNSFCKLITPTIKYITSYVIFTTTECNARCFYCFEKGTTRMSMSLRTAGDVAQYIIRHCGGNKVTIKWFGGEPLYNVDVIDSIINTLHQNNIKFKSLMTSNGYLFNKELITKAVNVWNLCSCMITLDGTEKVYNRIKSYIYKGTNPFKIVLDNIKNLINNKIFVTIRLNVHSENMDDLFSLLDLLNNEFLDKKYLFIDPHPIYNCTGTKRDETVIVRNMIYDCTLALTKRIKELGFHNKASLNNRIVTNKCMADSNHGIGILPDGGICKCEHFEGTVIGSIYSKEINTDILNKCKERVLDYKECISCAYRPECIQLKICVANYECNDFWRTRRLNRIRQLMLNTYKQFVNKKKLEKEDDGTELQC